MTPISSGGNLTIPIAVIVNVLLNLMGSYSTLAIYVLRECGVPVCVTRTYGCLETERFFRGHRMAYKKAGSYVT